MDACPPSPSSPADLVVEWDDVLGKPYASAAMEAAPTSCSERTPPPFGPGSSCGRYDWPTPTSLASASPMTRSSSIMSMPPSPLEAALAILKSPPRRGRASRERACTASISDAATRPPAGTPGTSSGALRNWSGLGFPSVLLRSVSESYCPTQASLATSSVKPHPWSSPSGLALLPALSVCDEASSPRERSTSAHVDDIIVDSPRSKRRKASKKGSDHIPRPPNSFFLYRSARIKEFTALHEDHGCARAQQADLSRQIAALWKAESPEVREEYARRAAREKEEHILRYPDYAFRPKQNPSRRASAKSKAGGSVKRSRKKRKADNASAVAAQAEHALQDSPTPTDADVLVEGTKLADDLVTAIDSSGLGSPLSPSSAAAGDIPTTPLTAMSELSQSYFLPPSTAASEAWTTFRSSSIAWIDPSATTTLPPFDQAPSVPQSAPAGLTSWGLDCSLAASTGAADGLAPGSSCTTSFPPPPVTYEELLASVPLADLFTPSSYDPPSPVYGEASLLYDSLEVCTLPRAPEPTPSAGEDASTTFPFPTLDISPDALDAFFQQLSSHYPSP